MLYSIQICPSEEQIDFEDNSLTNQLYEDLESVTEAAKAIIALSVMQCHNFINSDSFKERYDKKAIRPKVLSFVVHSNSITGCLELERETPKYRTEETIVDGNVYKRTIVIPSWAPMRQKRFFRVAINSYESTISREETEEEIADLYNELR
jgi:hypothetical protein